MAMCPTLVVATPLVAAGRILFDDLHPVAAVNGDEADRTCLASLTDLSLIASALWTFEIQKSLIQHSPHSCLARLFTMMEQSLETHRHGICEVAGLNDAALTTLRHCEDLFGERGFIPLYSNRGRALHRWQAITVPTLELTHADGSPIGGRPDPWLSQGVSD